MSAEVEGSHQHVWVLAASSEMALLSYPHYELRMVFECECGATRKERRYGEGGQCA